LHQLANPSYTRGHRATVRNPALTPRAVTDSILSVLEDP
jgi:hypothetical protein